MKKRLWKQKKGMRITWDVTDEDVTIAEIETKKGYVSVFITEIDESGEVEVETHCFDNHGEGFDGRMLYFEDIEKAKWYVEILADTLELLIK